MSRKTLASLGSAESLTGVPKDEIADKISDGHVKIYLPDLTPEEPPLWVLYPDELGDGRLWHVGYAERHKIIEVRKRQNGFQYGHYLLSRPWDAFYANALWQVFSRNLEIQGVGGRHAVAQASDLAGLQMMTPDGGFNINVGDRKAVLECKQYLLRLDGDRKRIESNEKLDTAGRRRKLQKIDDDTQTIESYINSIVGPKGMRTFPTGYKKDKDNIYHALHRAYNKIEDHGYREIAEFLRAYIETGYTVAYLPPDDYHRWILSAPDE